MTDHVALPAAAFAAACDTAAPKLQELLDHFSKADPENAMEMLTGFLAIAIRALALSCRYDPGLADNLNAVWACDPSFRWRLVEPVRN